METDKFEKHIKAQFKDREIRPSENAWSKISSELNTDERKKKPVYLWMGIAASIVVLLGVTLFYFNGDSAVNNVPTVIVDADKEEVLKEKKIVPLETIKKETPVVIAQTDDEKVNSVIKKKANKESKIQEIISLDDDIEVAVVENISSDKLVDTMRVSDDIINTKVAGIVAQIDVLEQYSSVTDAEVDSLLKRAQQEILREKIFNTDKSVDALALLTEVEGELDQSFRDQIFNSLKASFIKVRTAVVDRNN